MCGWKPAGKIKKKISFHSFFKVEKIGKFSEFNEINWKRSEKK